jgi:hypothetical protein
MPLYTEHYDLAEFQSGETYSASADRRRFSIIDSQMSFIAAQIGDGVIDGWEITAIDSNNISVGPGTAIIDGFFVQTYGNILLNITADQSYYLYMSRVPDTICQISAFSDVASTAYLDSTPPSKPATPTLVSEVYNQIVITWISNPEPDLAYYLIYRAEGTQSLSLYDQTATNTYTDNSVDQDSVYHYQTIAVDVNGNQSPPSQIFQAQTAVDVRVPGDPSGVEVLNGNQTLQVYWDAGIFLVDHYEISITPVTYLGVSQGSTSSISLPGNDFDYVYDNLVNGQAYQVIVQSVSKTGVLSPGVTVVGTPFYTGGALEVENIQVTAFPIDSISWQVALNVTWDLQADEYSLPDYYLITASGSDETGIASIYTTENATLYRYSIQVGTTQVTKTFQQSSDYTIRIQTVSGDVTSNGFIYKLKTPQFEPPQPVSGLTVQTTYSANDRFVEAKWQNSVSEFAYNELTVTRTPLDDEYGTPTYLVDAANYGQSSSVTLQPKDILNLCEYGFVVTPIDTSGNRGTSSTAFAVISQTVPSTTVAGTTIADSGSRPPVPSQQFGISGDEEATVYWNGADSPIIEGYKVYRAEFTGANVPSDFQAVIQTPGTIRKVIDYTVENGTNYAYFITTLDIFGNESLNPSDNYYSYPLIIVQPHAYNVLTRPGVINLTTDGNDVVLDWVPTQDSFDGHEVYRSKDNLYSFVFVGSTEPDVGTFRDVAALTLSGNYYYMVRKYRNEAQLIQSRSSLPPAGALAIGLVSNTPTGIEINDGRFIIKGMVGPIQSEMHKDLSVTPTHIYNAAGDDRRIRFQDNLVVNAEDWTTSDYQVFSTDVGLASTSDYIVYINGDQAAFSSKINVTAGTLTFDQAIYDPTTDTNVPPQPPSISAIFLNVNETTGILPAANVEGIWANRLTSGILDIERFGQISHFGRYRETLVPLSFAATQTNAYLFTATMPQGLTFYDIIYTTDGLLMAAASNGIIISSDDAANWDVLVTLTVPPTRLIYSTYLATYFYAAGNQVSYSSDRKNWNVISGMSGTNIVRELIEDGNGTIYASTDAGVFYCKPLEYVKVLWTQLPAFDDLDTNSYGIVMSDGYLYVSGGNGIYCTNNLGQTWQQISGSEMQVPCYSICIEGDYIFAVSNNRVWRKRPTDAAFLGIGDFSFPCRRSVLFAGSFYFTTDAGLYRSLSISDVFDDDEVSWNVAFQNMERNSIMPVTFSLNLFNNKMWLGNDEQIYSVSQLLQLQLQNTEDVISPTFFVNGTQRSVGIYYSTSGSVLFDSPLGNSDELTVVNQYTQFTSQGGWADTMFDAPVVLTVNGTDIVGPPVIQLINGLNWSFPPVPFTCSSVPSYVALALNQIQTPYFSERTANFDEAKAALTTVVQMTAAVQALADNGATTVPSTTVASLFQALEDFESWIQPTLRPLITFQPLNGTFIQSGYSVVYDVISGNVTIAGNIGKYSLVQWSVQGVALTNTGELTHDEIETAFEKLNSGLTTPLAYVQQSNVVKAGIYLKETGQLAPEFEFQSVHNGAGDAGWYNKLQSSIDYDEKLAFEPATQGSGDNESVGFSIEYPADVLFISSVNEVWVCGQDGIISIDVDDQTLTKVCATEFYFYSMNLSRGIVYALAEDGEYTIDPVSKVVSKQVDLDLPQGSNGVYVNGDTTYIAATGGIYSRRPFEPTWTLLFSLIKAKLRVGINLAFAIGGDPDDVNSSLVYYSYGGAIWNKTVFTDILVFAIAQRSTSVYYGTDSGLIVEDLSRLFQEQNFSGPEITRIQLTDDDLTLQVNDVDATADLAAAGTEDGSWYLIDGSAVTSSGESEMGTIHKVRIVGGELWLFANNQVEIVGQAKIIQLSTGKALI